MSEPLYDQEFDPGFLRKILALGIRTGLHRRVPGALLPAHFAGAVGGTKKSPRQRIAEIVERHGEVDGKGWPGAETMDMLVEREALRIDKAEADVLRAEWSDIRSLTVTDPQYVESRVAQWVDRLGVHRALLAAAELYGQGATGVEVRAQLAKDLRAATTAMDGTRTSLLESWRERLIAWESGDDEASKIPTGFRRLDQRIGGIRPGELFLFLAPPKGAKTAAQMNVVLNAARQHYGAVMFSFEMSARPMTMRMDRNIAQRTKYELREDTAPLKRAYEGWVAGGAGDVILYTDMPVSQSSCDAIERKVEEERRAGATVDLVAADFLNIMTPSHPDRSDTRDDLVLARTTREMKNAAQNLGVAFISAALVQRQAVSKPKLKKGDIARVFEAIAIASGVIGICSPDELTMQGLRHLWITALRDEEEDCSAGIVVADLDRMVFRDASMEQQTAAEAKADA